MTDLTKSLQILDSCKCPRRSRKLKSMIDLRKESQVKSLTLWLRLINMEGVLTSKTTRCSSSTISKMINLKRPSR
jgi:hypothetical protein